MIKKGYKPFGWRSLDPVRLKRATRRRNKSAHHTLTARRAYKNALDQFCYYQRERVKRMLDAGIARILEERNDGMSRAQVEHETVFEGRR